MRHKYICYTFTSDVKYTVKLRILQMYNRNVFNKPVLSLSFGAEESDWIILKSGSDCLICSLHQIVQKINY